MHFPTPTSKQGISWGTAYLFKELWYYCVKMDSIIKDHAISSLKFAYEVLGYEQVMKEILWYRHNNVIMVSDPVCEKEETIEVLDIDEEFCSYVLSNNEKCKIARYKKDNPTSIYCIHHCEK